ncbi:MAG: phosphatase PAP2 family protein [Oscillospiraceae bacterium]|nr:phosphatase PAP2 family protein [Oscillospiraceae bacterium]
MERKTNRFALPGGLLAVFALWTAAVYLVDVQPIGPLGSEVGFAALNGWFHALTGVHLWLYDLTDLLSVVPLGLCGAFGILGLCQWVRRKKLRRVDRDLLLLGGFYLAVAAFFVAFECFPVNFRPVLIEGRLEASYPSSTTLLVICVMSTAQMQLRRRLRPGALRRMVCAMLPCFAAFMVLARLVSGVHWLTDILGGAVLSAALVTAYRAVLRSE